MLYQLTDKLVITLIKVQEIVHPFLEIAPRKECVFYRFDLSQFIAVKTFLSPQEFPLNSFQTVDNACTFCPYKRPQRRINGLGLLLESRIDFHNSRAFSANRQVVFGVPEGPVVEQIIFIFEKL